MGIDKKADGSLTVNVEAAAGGKVESIDCDVALVCIGRRPFTQGLGLEQLGITMGDKGKVAVNSQFQVRSRACTPASPSPPLQVNSRTHVP
jgi:dihydrolipoamide dehydrogenase